MSLSDLLACCHDTGIKVGVGAQPDKLRVDAPAGALTPELKAKLAAHKPELLALLQSGLGNGPGVVEPAPRATLMAVPAAAPPIVPRGEAANTPPGKATNTTPGKATNTTPGKATNTPLGKAANTTWGKATTVPRDKAVTTAQGKATIVPRDKATNTTPDKAIVTISGRDFPYLRRWSGERLQPADGYLAFDTETEIVDLKREIPRLALASASASETVNSLIHPDDVGRFILAHRDLHFIIHNVAFDFWVATDHLRSRGEHEALRVWREIAVGDQLQDSMLLDMLVRLAEDDSDPRKRRDLSEVAWENAQLRISKVDPYRKRYGEIIGKDWATVEEGFFAYGIKDAIVTRVAYLTLRRRAKELVAQFQRHSNEILPDAEARFGVLTEGVQVKKPLRWRKSPATACMSTS